MEEALGEIDQNFAALRGYVDADRFGKGNQKVFANLKQAGGAAIEEASDFAD